jgi:hypothetical protein
VVVGVVKTFWYFLVANFFIFSNTRLFFLKIYFGRIPAQKYRGGVGLYTTSPQPPHKLASFAILAMYGRLYGLFVAIPYAHCKFQYWFLLFISLLAYFVLLFQHRVSFIIYFAPKSFASVFVIKGLKSNKDLYSHNLAGRKRQR